MTGKYSKRFSTLERSIQSAEMNFILNEFNNTHITTIPEDQQCEAFTYSLGVLVRFDAPDDVAVTGRGILRVKPLICL